MILDFSMRFRSFSLIPLMFLVVVATPPTVADGQEINHCQILNQKQSFVVEQSIKLGEPFDLSNSLAAIAIVESGAGKWLVNLQDPSAGVYHININTAMKRSPNKIDSNFTRNLMAQRLIEDQKFAAGFAIAELLYWKNYHHGNWNKVWASYNAGFNYDSSAGKRYARKIVNTIKCLKN